MASVGQTAAALVLPVTSPNAHRPSSFFHLDIYTIINFTKLSVVSVVSVTVAAALAGWPVILTSWPVTVGVVEVGGGGQAGADAER